MICILDKVLSQIANPINVMVDSVPSRVDKTCISACL